MSSAVNVIEMSVASGMKGLVEVCEMCMCLPRGSVAGEGVSGLGLDFTNLVRTWLIIGRVSVFGF